MEIQLPMECSSQIVLHSKHQIHRVTGRPCCLAEDKKMIIYITISSNMILFPYKIGPGKLQQHCENSTYLILLDLVADVCVSSCLE